jgi:ribonuclease P protein component
VISSLKLRQERDLVFRKGKRYNLSFGYLFFYIPVEEEKSEPAEIKILIVARKKLGNAVVRNKARRIVKEALRKVIKENDLKKVILVAIILTKADLKFEDVYNEFYEFFKRMAEIRVV